MANERSTSRPPLPDFLADYPFDLYQRTRDIRETIDIIAAQTGKETLKILDVGGFRVDADNRGDLLLREFLPHHEVIAVDMVEASAPGYIRGDGTRLPFLDNSFDVVVTSDVFEHVPPEVREDFVDNLLRVSSGYVVLGAPFYSERAALAEKIVFEYVRKVLHAEQEQLKEHIENSLPDPVHLQEFLNKREISFTFFNSGNLDGWLTMMLVEHYLMSVPETDSLRTMLDRYYNSSFYESDHGGDGYRRVFVMSCITDGSGDHTLKSIDAHFEAYAKSDEFRRLDQQGVDHVQMLLNLEALRSRALLEEKDGLIRHQAAQIRITIHGLVSAAPRIRHFSQQGIVRTGSDGMNGMQISGFMFQPIGQVIAVVIIRPDIRIPIHITFSIPFSAEAEFRIWKARCGGILDPPPFFIICWKSG